MWYFIIDLSPTQLFLLSVDSLSVFAVLLISSAFVSLNLVMCSNYEGTNGSVC